MLVVMKNDATEKQVKEVIEEIERMGYRGVPMPGAQRTAICIVGNTGPVDDAGLLVLEGVKETVRVTKQYKLVSRETHPQPTAITIGDIKIGAGKPVLMAGPCAVESEEQALIIARLVKKSGATVFRGGAFKPRSSPYSFQGPAGLRGSQPRTGRKDGSGITSSGHESGAGRPRPQRHGRNHGGRKIPRLGTQRW